MMRATQRRFSSDISNATGSGAERRGIPFDYAFRYELQGKPGNVINSIVTVSIEATFTAVSLGYGVVPKVQPIIFGPPVSIGDDDQTLGAITLRSIIDALQPQLLDTARVPTKETGPELALKNGIRLNPAVADFAIQGNPLKGDIRSRLFQIVGAPPDLIQFKYAIFDEGSGREFQSEPILNIAGLGSATGKRPFRNFAQPITFRPRSTIRMEVTEVSEFAGELHVSLHGYKVLGDPNSPTASGQSANRFRGR